YRNKRQRPAIGNGFPRHTPTILGDALHNLRAALDHAYCALVIANEGTVGEYCRFPFSKNGDMKSLEGSLKGHEKKGCAPSQKIIALILNEIEPFPGKKGSDLCDLHALDIADKHLDLLPTEQHTAVSDLTFSTGSSIRGLTLLTSNAPAIAFAPGTGLSPHNQNKVAFDICFGGGTAFEGKPILPILKRLHTLVVDTLQKLERAAAEEARGGSH
ncbi:MAG TPA: hypothetical protein VIL72_13585, partial [Beijerinckiaceae bacterium]